MQTELGKDDPAIVQSICAIPASAISSLISLILGQRKGHAAARAVLLGPDAGAPENDNGMRRRMGGFP